MLPNLLSFGLDLRVDALAPLIDFSPLSKSAKLISLIGPYPCDMLNIGFV